jgi:hypothetical protein
MATENQTLPSYITAADNHNIGNGNVSWLDPTSWSDKLGNIGRFVAGSILSGTNSFYNTGVAVGNWFGAEVKERDTATWITSFDTDLGKYYRENQEAVDLGGFVLGAIAPGLGGVRILNAGQVALKTAQQGMVGGTLSRATGLLVPKTDEFLAAAAADINGSTTALKLLNVNTTKAIGAGLWQNTLEAAAFETAVQVTMFKSPVLEQQTVGDIAANIALGGVLGGAIGGAFGAAKLTGKLKQSVREEDILRRPFLDRPSFAEQTSPAERIVQLSYDSEMAAVPVVLRNADGTSVNNNYAVNKTLYEDKIRKNDNEIRLAINELAK